MKVFSGAHPDEISCRRSVFGHRAICARHLGWWVAQQFIRWGRGHNVMDKRLVTWQQVEIAALTLGAKWATVRQWVHRGTIPARWELRLRDYFGEAFIIAGSAGTSAGKARPSLASKALAYVRREEPKK